MAIKTDTAVRALVKKAANSEVGAEAQAFANAAATLYYIARYNNSVGEPDQTVLVSSED